MSRTHHARPEGVRHRPGTAAFRKKLLERVVAEPGQTIPELAEFMDCKQNWLYRVLPAMQKDGEVDKRGRGWWAAGDERPSSSAYLVPRPTSPRPPAPSSAGVHTCHAGCPCHEGRAPVPDFVEAPACPECDGSGAVTDPRQVEEWERRGRSPEYEPESFDCPRCTA